MRAIDNGTGVATTRNSVTTIGAIPGIQTLPPMQGSRTGQSESYWIGVLPDNSGNSNWRVCVLGGYHWSDYGENGALAVAMVGMMVFLPFIILMHELSHALVGCLVGLRIFGIRIGSGPRFCRWQLGGLSIDVHWVPAGGQCWMAPDVDRANRWAAKAAGARMWAYLCEMKRDDKNRRKWQKLADSIDPSGAFAVPRRANVANN